MIELFVIGTVWFWVLLAVVSILILMDLEAWEKPGGMWSTVLIIGTFVTLYFMGAKSDVISFFSYIGHHPFGTFIYFLIYLLIGTVWSFVEWYFYVKGIYNEQKRLKELHEYKKMKQPFLSENKARITAWIFYWPWVMLWKATHKPIKHLSNYIFELASSTYERIAKSIYKDETV